ncbi:outer membrane beta-barrel protein [Arenibacter certesii]|uniref:Outer membrane protein beta-barrel domain-containing protein n=1 Tax=Arenibacter certesii TaxID=228955 RepID=A0A918MLD3_9FLAO|nr:outer membrane beta-barrel protein [Arenibacter certesii]GGW33220.1 hypothetical protein GCM10007383_17810 [Arenibacter certesii]
MKRIFVVAVLALFGFSVHAQEGFKAGANIGLPVGDAADWSDFSIGLDAAYHWEVADSFSAGIAAGFTNAIGKKIAGVKIDDIQFLPVAASGRFAAGEDFSLGADLGYAIGINDGNDGGFYYRPLVGYQIGSDMELNLSFTGISLDGGSWNTINLGVMFNL